ncbi:hypothetical protein C8R45DRAFT_935740 [Mycena sanguinolenta]|nr:hypothetical protein C8R45DRAFT_935740 [Mycena sanguinolenta]
MDASSSYGWPLANASSLGSSGPSTSTSITTDSFQSTSEYMFGDPAATFQSGPRYGNSAYTRLHRQYSDLSARHEMLFQAYTTLVNSLPRFIPNPMNTNTAPLFPSISQRLGDPSTASSAASAASPVAPLKADYPKLSYWFRDKFGKDDDLTTISDETRNKLGFLEHEDGTPFTNTEIAAVRQTAREVFQTLLDDSLAPQTWSNASSIAANAFRKELISMFPEIRLCAHNWKVYPQWTRNRKEEIEESLRKSQSRKRKSDHENRSAKRHKRDDRDSRRSGDRERGSHARDPPHSKSSQREPPSRVTSNAKSKASSRSRKSPLPPHAHSDSDSGSESDADCIGPIRTASPLPREISKSLSPFRDPPPEMPTPSSLLRSSSPPCSPSADDDLPAINTSEPVANDDISLTSTSIARNNTSMPQSSCHPQAEQPAVPSTNKTPVTITNPLANIFTNKAPPSTSRLLNTNTNTNTHGIFLTHATVLKAEDLNSSSSSSASPLVASSVPLPTSIITPSAPPPPTAQATETKATKKKPHKPGTANTAWNLWGRVHMQTHPQHTTDEVRAIWDKMDQTDYKRAAKELKAKKKQAEEAQENGANGDTDDA